MKLEEYTICKSIQKQAETKLKSLTELAKVCKNTLCNIRKKVKKSIYEKYCKIQHFLEKQAQCAKLGNSMHKYEKVHFAKVTLNKAQVYKHFKACQIIQEVCKDIKSIQKYAKLFKTIQKCPKVI